MQEVRRIRSQHLTDRQAVVNGRVKGKLSVTRAFGAGYLKQVWAYIKCFFCSSVSFVLCHIKYIFLLSRFCSVVHHAVTDLSFSSASSSLNTCISLNMLDVSSSGRRTY